MCLIERAAREQAGEIGAACRFGAVFRRCRWFAHFDGEAVVVARNFRCDVGFFARFAGENETGHQRYLAMGIGGVGAAHGARPQPGDNGQFLAEQGFEVGAGGAHLGGDGDCRVEVADALYRFVAHPVAVAAHRLGEAARTRPVLRHTALLFADG